MSRVVGAPARSERQLSSLDRTRDGRHSSNEKRTDEASVNRANLAKNREVSGDGSSDVDRER